MIPIWAQHLLVLAAVAASLAIIARQAFSALHGRKSRIAGCASCNGCASPAPRRSATQFIPLEALKRK